ncbi:hypothetical protein DFH09DRAFT_1362938 [Mycena vulgaris]|nr:hypothetical protein DFH09DRAFT_1362938 [Mycena vulgaris]
MSWASAPPLVSTRDKRSRRMQTQALKRGPRRSSHGGSCTCHHSTLGCSPPPDARAAGRKPRLRAVLLPQETLPRFLVIASTNTAINLEMCRLLLVKRSLRVRVMSVSFPSSFFPSLPLPCLHLQTLGLPRVSTPRSSMSCRRSSSRTRTLRAIHAGRGRMRGLRRAIRCGDDSRTRAHRGRMGVMVSTKVSGSDCCRESMEPMDASSASAHTSRGRGRGRECLGSMVWPE